MKNNIVYTIAAILLVMMVIAGCARANTDPIQKPDDTAAMESSGATTTPTISSSEAPETPATEPTTITASSTVPVTEPAELQPAESKPTEAPSDSTTPTEPAPTAPATEPAAAPTEQKPVTPPTIPPTEPKPTESTKPTEPKPTEPTTQPTEPPTEVPTQPAAGVTEADFPVLEEYARNYASSLGFFTKRSLGYNNSGYYPATYVSNESMDEAKRRIRGSVQALKDQLLACGDITDEMFNGTVVGFNCDLFLSDMGTINMYCFYG